LTGFGLGWFSHMQGPAVGALECSGNAALAAHALAQRRPAFGEAVLTQVAADDPHERVGEHGDEQMTGAAL